MKPIRAYLFLFLISGGVIALDQWTKALVRQLIPPGEAWSPFPWLTPYARLVHWYNSGAAFGLFQNGGLLFTILAILVSLAILYYYPRLATTSWLLRLALSLQLGGAIGNLIDRLTLGMVTDFISVGSFPVFNIADSSITIGVVLLLLYSWLEERARRRPAEAPTSSESPLSESHPSQGS